MRRFGISGLAMCAGLTLAAVGARAQDSADLVFWQSIQASKNAKEFQLYLQTYPNGRFAELARLRVAELEGGAAPAPAPNPAPAPVQAGNTGPAAPPPQPAAEPVPTLAITPAAVRVGQKFTVACVNFPDTSNASYDQIVVVPAGSPVMSPTQNPEQSKVVWRMYARNCGEAMSFQAGPLAPGAYEARWMSTLYNNDSGGRYELKAMIAFTIR